MKKTVYFLVIAFLATLSSCETKEDLMISGELKTWHKITLNIAGPELSEQGQPNPYLDYRLEATFSNGESAYVVPGYFAADGNAAESGATSGTGWKVNFAPDKQGTWEYEISFRNGKNIALSEDPEAGEPVSADGTTGTFEVEETDKSGRDFRGKGRLVPGHGRYLMHVGTGENFLKGGADSPENFMAYKDFDGTYYGGSNIQRSGEDTPNAGLHAYGPHENDWKQGDPLWQDKKGKGIIGALNYLASKGMNSVYFLTLNILGDGEDVWPYTDRNERYRFDCSKLDQWEIVFSHMEKRGIMMHVILQETENEHLLDGGYLDVQRKLYLRELVARFAHHNAITWNLGEEHGPVEWMDYAQSADDTKRMADYLKQINPYNQPIVMHTHPNQENRKEYLAEYLNFTSFDGPSIQAGNPMDAYSSTAYWIQASAEAGHPWFVCIDEIGQHWKGAMPDADDPAHDTIRKNVLWANLMAGGAGVEWYFGYEYAHADLNCEDWRSRDILWDQTRFALDFFQNHLPFHEMKICNEMLSEGYGLALENQIYAFYFPEYKIQKVDLSNTNGTFAVDWYNPRKGGTLKKGSVLKVKAGSMVSIGSPPAGDKGDWACLLKKL
ncbi:DUF5060 domain-containing protein [Bacteroidota bacterium]